jgi:hypothetical protein
MPPFKNPHEMFCDVLPCKQIFQLFDVQMKLASTIFSQNNCNGILSPLPSWQKWNGDMKAKFQFYNNLAAMAASSLLSLLFRVT